MSADWTPLVRSGAELLAKGGHEIGDGHADLAHRVALADRHLLVVERYEVDRDTERRSDLVLTAVSPADRLRLIVRGHERRPDLRPHLARERHKALVLRQRKDGHFVRGEMRTEAEHNARALLVGFLVVCGAEDRVRRPVRTDRRLDDMRNEPIVRDVVEVLEILARELGVATQVVVGAVMDTFELVPAKWERELDVRRRRGVMRALVIGVIAEPHLLFRDALLYMPREARFLPLVVEARSIGRAREVLHLHLLELARSEDEVAGGDLVAERLADLRDPERELLSRRLLDVLEVDEDGLCRLRPEPGDGCGVLDRSDEGLEHKIELPRVRELALAAVRTGHAREVELLGAPRGRELFALREIIEPEPLAAVAALDQRVGEILHVPRRFPHTRVHEDRAVQANDVFSELDHRPPPGVLDVALELDAERTEVPRRARAPIDLARRKHEAAPLRERRDLLGNVLRFHETGAWCGSVRSSSMRCVVEMSRSSTYRRKPRRCRSSSAVRSASIRRRDAAARSLTRRYRSDFRPRTVSGATYGRPAAQPAQIAPPAAGSHAFVSSARAVRHCPHSPSSGRKPERSRRWRSNQRHTVGALMPVSSARRDVSSRSKSGADGTRSAVNRSTSSATYQPAAMRARSSRISG